MTEQMVFWILAGGIVVFFILPIWHVAVSDRSSGGETFGWILAILFLSLLGYAAFLVFAKKKEPSATTAQPDQSSLPRTGALPVADRPRPPDDLADDTYRLRLVEQYQIKKNDTLNQFVCAGKLFPTVDAALEHAHKEEGRRWAEAEARHQEELRQQAAAAELKAQQLRELQEKNDILQKRWKARMPYLIGASSLAIVGAVSLYYLVDWQMVTIPAGSFQMGGSKESREAPIHTVNIPAFQMAKTEVTQAQWRAVMGDNPSKFSSCGDSCPVETVSWDDIQIFLQKLNAKTGKQYRLPSEAEWEYACRAGGNHEYCGGNDLNAVGWTKENSGKKIQFVGKKRANAFGLYDMSGNVFEWTSDCLNVNYSGAPSNGSAWTSGDCSGRVVRGGAWSDSAVHARAARRLSIVVGIRHDGLGFRLARTLP